MRRAAVLFDLDGTLVDSLPDIAHALSAALAAQGLGPYTAQDLRPWLGGGARTLLARAQGLPIAEVDVESVSAFLTMYAATASDRPTLYPGVSAALASLDCAGLPLAICTNKPRATLRPTLRALGWDDRFAVVLCPDDGPAKPAPHMLLAAARAIAIAPAQAIYLGDSASDSAAARAAGMPFAHASWGYGEPLAGDPSYDSISEFMDAIRPPSTRGTPKDS